MKIFVTSNCLSTGAIFEADGRRAHEGLWAIRTGTGLYAQYVHKEHVHETLEAAQVHARAMREARIKGLQTQLAKMRALRFGD